jgi:hypothetical protein
VSLFVLFVISVFIAHLLLGGSAGFKSGESVGIVEVKGMLLDSKETIKQLHEFRDDQNIKAVVLRIDSPGGVVGPSQEIYEEVKKLTAKKKVVASMGSLAASGGYYIAGPANMIFANPGTVTGSIGVLMKLSNIEGPGKDRFDNICPESGSWGCRLTCPPDDQRQSDAGGMMHAWPVYQGGCRWSATPAGNGNGPCGREDIFR